MAMPNNKAMHMVDRKEWEGIPPRYRFKTERPVEYILLRYTMTPPCSGWESCNQALRDIQKVHMVDKGWPDILYSFVVATDGRVYEGTGWKHTTNKEDPYSLHDFNNIDIAYIGRNKDDVTDDMRWAARKLLDHSMSLDHVKPDAQYIGNQEAIDLLFT